jgi:hypothetical protein
MTKTRVFRIAAFLGTALAVVLAVGAGSTWG